MMKRPDVIDGQYDDDYYDHCPEEKVEEEIRKFPATKNPQSPINSSSSVDGGGGKPEKFLKGAGLIGNLRSGGHFKRSDGLAENSSRSLLANILDMEQWSGSWGTSSHMKSPNANSGATPAVSSVSGLASVTTSHYAGHEYSWLPPGSPAHRAMGFNSTGPPPPVYNFTGVQVTPHDPATATTDTQDGGIGEFDANQNVITNMPQALSLKTPPGSRIKNNSVTPKMVPIRSPTVNEPIERHPKQHHRKELWAILKEVSFIANRMRGDDDAKLVQNDWRYAAMVIDRLCLILFTTFLVVSTCVILFDAPHLI